ncbi:MAG TPA: response regulator [Thermomicrobiaceae bacterium]|nr:response regulator [Thermomicrobiaceae bacterium]
MVGRILVVDDDPAIRDLLDELLSDEGYEVYTAPDGRAAIAAAQARQPHVILMDLMMPYVDGITATRTLKGDPTTDWIQIIAMSAGVNLRMAAAQLPADGLVGKPFDIDALLADVHLHLRRALDGDPTVR